MGAKQSSPAPNGRTRAYSGSDLPSATGSSNGSSRSVAASAQGSGLAAGGSGNTTTSSGSSSSTLASGRLHLLPPPAGPRSAAASSSSSSSAGRNTSLNIPNSGGTHSSSQDESEGSTPEESTAERPGGQPAPRLLIGSLPAHLSPHLFGGFKCPVCSKFVSADEMDLHLVMCLTKPRVTYNEDVLSKDTGECAICLEELQQGDTIARLPCLCIYHKGCIDSWFEVNRSCPEHPSD
ncbi:E3 ubiquitin-protein ligase znrf2-like [Mustelus asterias]